jgi:uncharacterized damage-inducible protein DinB
MQQLIETWQIQNKINLYLLHSIEPQNLLAISLSKGRNVGEHFAHIHNVRLMWLHASMPQLLNTVSKIDKTEIEKEILETQIKLSGVAIEKLLEQGFIDGKIKGFKPHPSAFLGYLIAHESHHRGQILTCLKQFGTPISKKISFGLWEWGTK